MAFFSKRITTDGKDRHFNELAGREQGGVDKYRLTIALDIYGVVWGKP